MTKQQRAQQAKRKAKLEQMLGTRQHEKVVIAPESWWLSRDRASFQQAVKDELARMQLSKFSRWHSMVSADED